ncbi:MAG: ABC transporter permease [Patescibacteria group bacterium]
MRISDTFAEAYEALASNKARSGLTILGIVIGISSVVVLLALGEGAKQSVEESIQSIGSNMLIVNPGAPRQIGGGVRVSRGSAQSLTMADSDGIKAQVTGINSVAPTVTSNSQLVTRGANTNVQIVGTTADYASVRSLNMQSGSFLTVQHERGWPKVIVLGPTTAEDLFGEGVDPVGQKVKISGSEYTVIGVTESKGGSGFTNQDDIAYIPVSTAMQFLSGSEYLSNIYVEAESETTMDSVQAQIEALLLQLHGKTTETVDFYVQNQADVVETASSVTGTLTALLAAIAAISLVVGGIGIMNMMLTAVTERTREIGLRKALGAKRGEITLQFLVESVMLTVIGGGLGVFLGWVVAQWADQFIGSEAAFQTSIVLLAFAVSAGIGIVFGYYPARRAASFNPIEALRHE